MDTRISATGTTNPADPFGGSLFDELAFFGGGVISPGDTVVFEGFTCIVNSGGTCPEPPELSEVPLPPALLLFAAAWVGLGAGGRIARWRVNHQR